MKLTVQDLNSHYGPAHILFDVGFEVGEGEVVALLGRNGAGKSTTFRSIVGLVAQRSGRIIFEGKDVSVRPTHEIVRRGIACIPEGRRVFPKLTAAENLRLGAYGEGDAAKIAERLARVYAIFPRLEERARQLAGTLSGGEQAMLSIGRGLMSEPRLLLIDEPSLGLAPLLVKENFAVIRRVHGMGITVLLVEQNVRQTLAIAQFGYVLSQGKVVASGTAAELAANAEVHQAYFG